MINENNFEDLLIALGFKAQGKIYSKNLLSVDFDNRKLIYPAKIRGGDRNNNFDAPENFVVFECVNRLLEKGYRPEDIELEKAWQLGHDAKSGRADICVSDMGGDMLFIIECKTWGNEFDKALRQTKQDGAQLFSYWQQEGACKLLVLYASDFEDNNKIIYRADTINCSDDENLKLLAVHDENIKLYLKANTVKEKYAVWDETYKKQLHDDLIFASDTKAYEIGVRPLRKRDLKEFNPSDKIINKFEE